MSGLKVDVSIAIDTELFIWAANLGKEDRAAKKTIRLKEDFLVMDSVKAINYDLSLDMYRAYRAGYSLPPLDERVREYND